MMMTAHHMQRRDHYCNINERGGGSRSLFIIYHFSHGTTIRQKIRKGILVPNNVGNGEANSRPELAAVAASALTAVVVYRTVTVTGTCQGEIPRRDTSTAHPFV